MPRRRRPPRPGALADLRPWNILSQMLLLQGFYYAIALILIVFTTFVAGKHPDPSQIFDWRNVRGDVTTGWTLGLCWMLDALVTYVYITSYLNTLLTSHVQSHPITSTDRPLKTGSGLCPHDPLHPSDSHLTLHASYPKHDCLVGVADLFGVFNVWTGYLGLSVEGVETYDVRR